jgi:hypothetical protein
MDLTTMTPVEIDTILYDLYRQHGAAQQRVESERQMIFHTAGARRQYGRGSASWNMTFQAALDAVKAQTADETYIGRQATERLAKYEATIAAREAVRAEMNRIGAEFTSRGGWTRSYLVTDGHVHSSMECSTCNNGQSRTQFTWLVDFAGRDEAEVVAAAAARACTVCYPTAPVETAGPSALMTEDERTRAQKRDDAEKAKADRLAKRIEKGLTADGSEFVVSYRWLDRERRESFKTEQAATSWLVQYTLWDHGRTDEKAPAFAAIREAIAVKHGWTAEQVEAHLAAKMVAKVKRDEGISKADAEAKVAQITKVAAR